jgi:exopolyphosphatase/pppGpp-phosphohydrolase
MVRKTGDEIMQHLSLINFVGVSIDNAIAIAGTPTTLATIKKNLTSYDEQKVEGDELNVSDLNDFVKELSTLTNLEIKSLYKAVINNREDLLLSGSLLLYNIMRYLNISKVMVSTKGLRYGTLFKKYFL